MSRRRSYEYERHHGDLTDGFLKYNNEKPETYKHGTGGPSMTYDGHFHHSRYTHQNRVASYAKGTTRHIGGNGLYYVPPTSCDIRRHKNWCRDMNRDLQRKDLDEDDSQILRQENSSRNSSSSRRRSRHSRSHQFSPSEKDIEEELHNQNWEAFMRAVKRASKVHSTSPAAAVDRLEQFDKQVQKLQFQKNLMAVIGHRDQSKWKPVAREEERSSTQSLSVKLEPSLSSEPSFGLLVPKAEPVSPAPSPPPSPPVQRRVVRGLWSFQKEEPVDQEEPLAVEPIITPKNEPEQQNLQTPENADVDRDLLHAYAKDSRLMDGLRTIAVKVIIGRMIHPESGKAPSTFDELLTNGLSGNSGGSNNRQFSSHVSSPAANDRRLGNDAVSQVDMIWENRNQLQALSQAQLWYHETGQLWQHGSYMNSNPGNFHTGFHHTNEPSTSLHMTKSHSINITMQMEATNNFQLLVKIPQPHFPRE